MDRKGDILVFEPDDLIRELLVRWLGEAGYKVVVVNSGGSGAYAALVPPVLVIANFSRPRDAQTRIQLLQASYGAPILAISARFRRGLGTSDETARRLGVQKVLPKPFTRKELLSTVRELIEGSH